MSWFKEIFKRDVGAVGANVFPTLDIKEGDEVVVEFLEDHPRVVNTKIGPRAVINVMVEDNPYSLWLSRLSLANEIAVLESQVESMKGKKAKIVNVGKMGRMYAYKATWITKSQKATEIAERVKE
jgi:hypothetical protein